MNSEQKQEQQEQQEQQKLEMIVEKKKRIKPPPLKTCYSEDTTYEIGVDEVGRGPMFGRVYTAAVCLPKDVSLFDHSLMKDSKKFTGKNKQKIQDIAEYIKDNAISWTISYEDESVIDEVNILQATQQSMHKCILETVKKIDVDYSQIKLLIDGNYFKPCILYNPKKQKLESLDFICIEGGDNKFTAIAAASILAKVARDQYIFDLCEEYPYLKEQYQLDSNKGYGSKTHMAGILEYGITPWHRKTFGICKNYVKN